MTIEQIEKELAEREAELVFARKRIEAIEGEKQALTNRSYELAGWRGYGIISRLRSELEQAKREHADKSRPNVRVYDWSGELCDRRHVITRITAKSIFTRKAGGEHETRWNRDGTATGKHSLARIHADDVPPLEAPK